MTVHWLIIWFIENVNPAVETGYSGKKNSLKILLLMNNTPKSSDGDIQ